MNNDELKMIEYLERLIRFVFKYSLIRKENGVYYLHVFHKNQLNEDDDFPEDVIILGKTLEEVKNGVLDHVINCVNFETKTWIENAPDTIEEEVKYYIDDTPPETNKIYHRQSLQDILKKGKRNKK